MEQGTDYIRLVRQAQAGHRPSLDRLAEIARPRLRSHVFRMTLREDVTQDIVQDSLLEMLRIIGRLKRADRFWPWLFGIATNKLHRYHRNERKHHRSRTEPIGYGGAGIEDHQALEDLLARELREIISRAMAGLKPRHRAVLSMRCYEEMTYAQIAEALGCSTFAAQMLFYRAKRCLAKQLARRGLGKGTLLMALVVFGKMTASGEAAAAQLTVSASALQVGLAATMAGLASSKGAIVSVAAAGVVGASAVVMQSGPTNDTPTAGPIRAPAGVTNVQPRTAGTSPASSWYFFPDGPQGVVMLRQMGRDASGRSVCTVLENGQGNYHYDPRTGRISLDNWHAWDSTGAIRLLPTDPPWLRQRVAQAAAGSPRPGGSLDSGSETLLGAAAPNGVRGLLVVQSVDEGGQLRVAQHVNALEEEYFQFDWPAGTPVVDRRDAMHRRGWTSFEIRGRYNGELVTGRGRLPLTYAQGRMNPAWMELCIGRVVVADTPRGAVVRSPKGARGYPAGTFLWGLARPWMGLHTVDTIRRDALLAGATVGPLEMVGDGTTCRVAIQADDVELVYHVAMERDLIDRVELCRGTEAVGWLEWVYDQAEPASWSDQWPYVESGRRRSASGTLWLIQWLDEGIESL